MVKEMGHEKGSFPLSLPYARISINREVLPAGSTLFRVHRSCYAGNAFNTSGNGSARFSPLFGASGKIIPTLYTGENTRVALCEVVLHDIDITQPHIVFSAHHLASFRHSQLVSQTEIILACFDLPSLVKMRVSKRLIHGDASEYPLTQRWARAIYLQYPDIQGLVWPSRQHEGKAWLFFGDRLTEQQLLLKGKTRTLVSPPVFSIRLNGWGSLLTNFQASLPGAER